MTDTLRYGKGYKFFAPNVVDAIRITTETNFHQLADGYQPI